MLLKLAKKNIKMNVQNYMLYFIASIFNVAIYFVFQNIWFNKQINAFLEDDGRILILFKGASIIILIFSIIFISYFSSFFIRKRKKELALYSLFGMKKIDITKLLFLENIILGIAASILGIVFGIIISKGFMWGLLNLIGMSLNIKFELGIDAIRTTFVTFGILFLISSLYTSTMIYRFKLIDLFNSDKETENIETVSKTKCTIGAFITLVLIIMEVVLVSNIKDSRSFYINAPLTFIFALISTFMFFGTFLSFFGNRLKANKNVYYRKNNIISISSFLYRIKSNKRLLAVIALTNAVALTAISVTYSLDYNMKEIDRITYPFSYCYVSYDNKIDEKIEDIISSYPQHQITNYANIKLNKVDIEKGNAGYKNVDSAYLISESNYKEALKIKNMKYDLSIKSDKDAILLEYYGPDINSIKDKKLTISYGGMIDELEITKSSKVEPLNEMDLRPVIVVSDSVYKKYENIDNEISIIGYSVENAMVAKELTKELIKTLPPESGLSYSQDMIGVMMFTSIFLFTGIFIGLVFLSSTGSILYFKQLSEATDDKNRYHILKKIGFSKEDTKISIKKQVRAIFILPVFVGLFHSLAALIFLRSTMTLSITIPVITSIVVYALIYFLYYMITVNTYVKIVMED